MACQNNIKAGYWLTQQAATFPPKKIPSSYFTHLFYAFVAVDATTSKLKITDEDLTWIPIFIDECEKENPEKKALLSIGGPKSTTTGDDPSIAISNMAQSKAKRSSFISSTIRVAEEYSFDGLELAWEFPKTPEDMVNMASLFEEWRERIKKSTRPNLLLVASVYFAAEIPREHGSIQYPVEVIKKNVDFVNAILYDYSPVTVAHGQVRVDANHNKSTEKGITSWTKVAGGIPADKLIMGIPLYGQKWTLANPDDMGIGAPIVSFNGAVPFKDIPSKTNATYDNITMSEYVADGTSWFGFDGKHSIKEKVQYARGQKLGGYFLYPLGDDDVYHTLSETGIHITF